MVGPPKALFLSTKTGHEQGVVRQRARCVTRGQLQHCGYATGIVVGSRVNGRSRPRHAPPQAVFIAPTQVVMVTTDHPPALGRIGH